MTKKTEKQAFQIGKLVRSIYYTGENCNFTITEITLRDGIIRYSGDRLSHIKYSAAELVSAVAKPLSR